MEEEDNDGDPVLRMVRWEDFLQDYSQDGDYIHGFVSDQQSVDSILELYRRATRAAFCTRRSSSLHFDPLKCKNRKFCTRSFVFCRSVSPRISDDGVPFTYGGMKILECQYGPKREHRKKSDIVTAISTVPEEKMSGSLEYLVSSRQKRKNGRQRLCTGETRKKGCPAKISVWHICRLPEYVVTAKKSVTIWQTRAKESLLQDLQAGKDVMVESRFYISLPLHRAHTKHTSCGQTAEAHSVHPQIIQWIEQLVAEGVTTIRDVQAVLRHNVQTKMSDIIAPDEQDRAYYPTLKDIANHIYKSKVKRRSSNVDFGTFVREAHMRATSEQETAVNRNESAPPSPAHLQLEEPHSISEDTAQPQEVTSCPDEAARRERMEIHKELNAVRRSSSLCSDVVRLARLTAGIKALHHQFRTESEEQTPPVLSACTKKLKRKERGSDSTTLLPSKTARQDNHDHPYLNRQAPRAKGPRCEETYGRAAAQSTVEVLVDASHTFSGIRAIRGLKSQSGRADDPVGT